MYIEVTDADVREFEKLSGFEADDWHPTFTKKIISAAWEVMRKKQQDDLAEAVKEAIKDDCWVECFEGNGNAVIGVHRYGDQAERHVSLDDNFSTLAAAAVRDLSRQVRQ